MPHNKKYNPDWQVAKTHFEADLHAVAQTSDGPYAVGTGGTVVTSTEHGWVPVITSGPAAKNSTLRTIASTSDGNRIWFAGANGALGMYNVAKGKLHNYSYSGDITDSWRNAAVAGKAGQETVLLTNGSGAILRFTVSGTDVTWGEPTKPGGGSTLTSIAYNTDTPAYAADSNGTVYESSDGKKWTKIGVPDAQTGFNDICIGPNKVFIAADDGRLFSYDRAEKAWTPIGITNTAIRAVDIEDKHLVVMADDNEFYWRTITGSANWQKQTAPTGKDLLDMALGYPDAAVGKAGTVVIRPPMEKPKTKQEKHKDPKKKQQKDPHPDPCPIILEELVTRLETDQLIELLEVKGCYTNLVESVKQGEEEKLTKLLEETEILPLLLADLEEEHGHHEHHAHGERHAHGGHHETRRTHKTGGCGHTSELHAEELDVKRLRRLLGC